MAEHDITLVTAKAGSVIAENMKVSLATASGGVTPATLTAMVGIAQGGAVNIAPSVTTAISSMNAKAEEWIAANINLGLAASLQSAATNIQTQADLILPPGNPAAFGQVISQAQGHISDALEIKQSMNFMANTSFDEFGVGISNMSTMTTQGVDAVVGNLSSASTVFSEVGPIYDLTDMKNFGSSVGVVNKLNSIKLANTTGVNAALAKAGVDLSRLDDPVYADSIDKALSSITDPAAISTVVDQLGITPHLPLTSLKDLTDLSKLVNPTTIPGLTASLKDMGSKFSDIGAKFKDSAAAQSLMNTLETPVVPNLNSAASSMSSMISGLSSTVGNITGSGSGPLGLPSITDFTQSVSGGPTINSMIAAIQSNNTSTISNAITSVNLMISNASNLANIAGIDLTTPVANNMGTAMSFATSLHRFGADTSGSGIADVLKNMATGDQYGDAIKAALAEGKNKAAMAANGIKELVFKT